MMTNEDKSGGTVGVLSASSDVRGKSVESENTSKKLEIESLDISLKKRQIVKADLEIRQLTNIWPRLLEVIQKVAAPLLVVAGALYAFRLGVPQAKVELANAQVAKVAAVRESAEAEAAKAAANKESAEAGKKTAEANERVDAANAKVVILDDQIKAKDKELAAKAKEEAKYNEVLKKDVPQGSKPRVFVQFQGAITREAIDKLRAKLSASGFETPPAERKSGSYKNQVKYFSKSANDVANARRIVDLTNEFLVANRCQNADLMPDQVSLPSGKTSPLELWLNVACLEK